jgi:hypothetical protein
MLIRKAAFSSIIRLMSAKDILWNTENSLHTDTADFLSRFHNITEGWEYKVPYLEQFCHKNAVICQYKINAILIETDL